MSSVNKVILIGNVGKEPEIRSTHDGREVANLVLATNESWKDKDTGDRKEKTAWHRISCFNPGLVNVIRSYVKKGAKLYVEGSLQTRRWKDKDDVERYQTEIVLQGYNCVLTMLDKPTGSDQSSGYESQHEAGGSNADALNDDIPF